MATLQTRLGVLLLVCSSERDPVRTETDATNLVGEALGARADGVVIPVELLPHDFFVLRTGLAGQIAQKFVNYRLRLVVLGDVSAHLERSPTLRDFVAESNRGRQVWFVPSLDELDALLATR